MTQPGGATISALTQAPMMLHCVVATTRSIAHDNSIGVVRMRDGNFLMILFPLVVGYVLFVLFFMPVRPPY